MWIWPLPRRALSSPLYRLSKGTTNSSSIKFLDKMHQTRRVTRALTQTSTVSSLEELPSKKLRLSKTNSVVVEKTKERDTSRPARGAKKTLQPTTFLPRVNSLWKVGAHTSSAGGVENAVINAAAIGASAFALFLKSQRKWTSPPLSEKSIASFKEKMTEHKYSPDVVLPHGSYLINLGNPDPDKREKSYECFIDDLRRCELLGLKYYNFHPGSTVGKATKDESISLIAECINKAHNETKSVVTVIENMAGAGNIIGGEFSDLRGIIDKVVDKSRVGVCLDTCHSFAAGYDLRTKDAWNDMLNKFNEEVGLPYLRGMHMNDSKTDLGSHRDRHENIGMGYLGIGAFRHIMNDPRIQNIPIILETPSFEMPLDIWAKEIAILQQLSTVTMESRENREAVNSIIGDAHTEEALLEVLRNAIQEVQGTNGKKSGTSKGSKKSGKRKRGESSEEDDDDEIEQ